MFMHSNIVHPVKTLMERAFVVVFLSIFALGCFPPQVFGDEAKGLTVTPAVVDEKASARDILNKSITIQNTTSRKLMLYPSVNDVNPEAGEQAFAPASGSQGLSNSLANWIELSRGVIEISPGETKQIPFVIHVNLSAVPNMYHAQVSFFEGGDRSDAESRTPAGSVIVNLEVKSDAKEILQLKKFSTDNVVFTGDDVIFKYQVQNIGNLDLHPSGEISIYNRRGEEIASLDVNKEGRTVSPDQSSQLASVWNGVQGFGRYKALLTVNYGSQTAAVTDTVFFWVIPWKQLLGLFVVSMIAIIFLALYFQRWFEDRHLNKLAHAGLIKHEVLAHLLPTVAPGVLPAGHTAVMASHVADTSAVASSANVSSSPKIELPPKPKRRLWPFKKKDKPVPGPAPVFQSFVPPQQKAETSEMTDAPVALATPKRSLREAWSARLEKAPTHGATIDLKTMHEKKIAREAAVSHAQGHVINLKRT